MTESAFSTETHDDDAADGLASPLNSADSFPKIRPQLNRSIWSTVSAYARGRLEDNMPDVVQGFE